MMHFYVSIHHKLLKCRQHFINFKREGSQSYSTVGCWNSFRDYRQVTLVLIVGPLRYLKMEIFVGKLIFTPHSFFLSIPFSSHPLFPTNFLTATVCVRILPNSTVGLDATTFNLKKKSLGLSTVSISDSPENYHLNPRFLNVKTN